MKKLLTAILSMLLLLGLFGCEEPEVIDEPKVVKLTEETALEYAKGLPFEVLLSVENLQGLIDGAEFEMNIIKNFCGLKEFEKETENKVGISVKTLQAKVDEMYGEKRFDVAKLLAKYVDDGYIMGKVIGEIPDDVGVVEISEYFDISYKTHEVTEKYVIIQKLFSYSYTYDGVDYREDMQCLIIVYPTTKGLKIWDCVLGLADEDVVVVYLPQ